MVDVFNYLYSFIIIAYANKLSKKYVYSILLFYAIIIIVFILRYAIGCYSLCYFIKKVLVAFGSLDVLHFTVQKYAFFLIQPKKLCETAPQRVVFTCGAASD